MRASLVVVNTPHSAIAGDFGSYTIMNVPPGQYRLVMTFGSESSERAVEVTGTHATLDARSNARP
jgi:hypothetical protein